MKEAISLKAEHCGNRGLPIRTNPMARTGAIKFRMETFRWEQR